MSIKIDVDPFKNNHTHPGPKNLFIEKLDILQLKSVIKIVYGRNLEL